MTSRRSPGRFLALVGALLALSACQGSEEPVPDRQPQVTADEVTSYVSLGDSYTSGPEISPQQEDSGVCLRSGSNYPHLLAERLGIADLEDVSCAGASTRHILNDVPVAGQQALEAQKDALSSRTQLVTLTIGYNNDQVFGNLLGSCITSAEVEASTCQTYASQQIPSVLKDERSDVVATLTDVRRAAPNARVVLVGYLPAMPEPQSCAVADFTAENSQTFFDTEQAIDENLADAAQQAGTDFVSMRAAAAGHGVCAGGEAWLNGSTAAKGDGVVFHPRASGMQAVATALEAKLREPTA